MDVVINICDSKKRACSLSAGAWLHSSSHCFFFSQIRQSLTKVTEADSMKEDFVPTFWFEDEHPTPPQFIADPSNPDYPLTGSDGAVLISATTPDMEIILKSSDWYISGSSPGNVSVQVSLTGCACKFEIHVQLLPLLSRSTPEVIIETQDEQHVFESEKFKWQGSFSHLLDGAEHTLQPAWVVPGCAHLPSSASWQPCPVFLAPKSPAIYADFLRLATRVDPFTIGDFRAELVAAPGQGNTSMPNRSSTTSSSSNATFSNITASRNATSSNANSAAIHATPAPPTVSRNSTNAEPPANSSSESAAWIVRRQLMFKVTRASKCSETQRVRKFDCST